MKTITNGTALNISRWLGKRVRAHSKLDGAVVEGVLCEEAEGVEGFFVLTSKWYMVGINQKQRIDLLDDVPDALAAPPDPWTRRPKGGWTAKTLPKQPGTWWAVATCDDDGHVNMFTPSEFGEIDDCSAMAAWRYIDAPTALDGAARAGE